MKAGAQKFIVDARASDRHFLRPPSGPWLTGEGLCHAELQGAPEDAQNWFVGSADFKNAFRQLRIPGWLQAFFFCTPGVLASEVGYTGKTIERKRLVPDSLIYLVPTTLPMGFSGTMFFGQDVTDHCTLSGSADSHLFVCRDHSKPLLLGSKHGMGSRGFRWSYADNFWVLARCNDVHLARLIAGVQKAGLDVHDTSPAHGSADVLGNEVSPSQRVLQWNEQRRADGLFASSHWRAGNGTRQWSLWRSANVVLFQSLTPASISRGRPVC